MTTHHCPSPSELADFLHGRSDEAAAEAVATHARSCSTCQASLHTSHGQDDTFVSKLRQELGPGEFGSEPALLGAIEKLLEMATSASGHSAATPEAEAACPAQVGTLLGPYLLQAQIGQGGMGYVFKAQHTRLEMPVAVKITSERLTNDRLAVSRFDREMKAVGKVNHPNIVRATDAGEHDGRRFLAMEFVDGVDLGRILKSQGKLRISDACEVIRQAAVGIEHAHRLGLIHRDLKPANLMVTREGQVKVLDLGLARLQSARSEPELTDDFQVMGTADYMSPEQAASAASVDERTDIYSLGCTLYALLCGRAPFADSAHLSPLKKLIAHERELAPPVGEHRSDVPPELEQLAARALAKSPADRFTSAAELAKALQPFVAGADLASLADHSTSDVEPEAMTSDFSKHAPQTDTVPTRLPTVRPAEPAAPQLRWRWPALVGMLLVAGIAATVIVKLITSSGTIVVEIEGDHIQTDVEGEELIIKDRQRGETYRMRLDGEAVQRKLKPGDYTIHVANERSSLRLRTNEFRIVRDQRLVVRAYAERNEPPSSATLDQQVARWVLENGGDMELISRGEFLLANSVVSLPDEFLIHRIRFFSHVELTDEDIVKLSRLVRLADLNLRGVELTDAFVERLARISQLFILQLDCREVTATTLVPLRRMSSLMHISFEGPPIDDRFVPMIAELPVRELILWRAAVSHKCLPHLAKMRQLQWLQIKDCDLTNADFTQLRSLTQLEKLNLSDSTLTDDCLRGLQNLPGLKQLDLAGTPIDDRSVPQLAMLTQLSQLQLDGRMSADAVQQLKNALPNCTISAAP